MRLILPCILFYYYLSLYSGTCGPAALTHCVSVNNGTSKMLISAKFLLLYAFVVGGKINIYMGLKTLSQQNTDKQFNFSFICYIIA
jgi:hypothetical protein